MEGEIKREIDREWLWRERMREAEAKVRFFRFTKEE